MFFSVSVMYCSVESSQFGVFVPLNCCFVRLYTVLNRLQLLSDQTQIKLQVFLYFYRWIATLFNTALSQLLKQHAVQTGVLFQPLWSDPVKNDRSHYKYVLLTHLISIDGPVHPTLNSVLSLLCTLISQCMAYVPQSPIIGCIWHRVGNNFSQVVGQVAKHCRVWLAFKLCYVM